MTRNNFLKLAFGAATLPSTLVGRGVPDAPKNTVGRAVPSAPKKIARAQIAVENGAVSAILMTKSDDLPEHSDL